jgi:hypothetical protein
MIKEDISNRYELLEKICKEITLDTAWNIVIRQEFKVEEMVGNPIDEEQ